MLQLSVLREQTDLVVAGLNKKNYKNAAEEVAALLDLDQRRRQVQSEHDELQARANSISKEIGILMKNGEREKAETYKAQTTELKQQAKTLADQLASLEEELQLALYKLPNLPHESVPVGRTAEDNEVVLQHGEIPELHAGAQPHWELIQKYDIIDFDLGNKITGAGFPVYKKQGARLQRALINFFLD